MHFLLDFTGHGDPPYSQDITSHPVADYAAHDGLGDGAESLLLFTDLEKIEDWIFHSELNDPLNVDDVEVPGQHQRLGGIIAALILALTTGRLRAKSKLFFEDPRCWN